MINAMVKAKPEEPGAYMVRMSTVEPYARKALHCAIAELDRLPILAAYVVRSVPGR